MNRHYYISDDLDELERIERELENRGLRLEQIHVLTERNAEVQRHRLHSVPSLLKRDVIRSSVRGALIGVVMASLALLIPYLAGWTDTLAGWGPFLLLAGILLGFCTWEGGFFGLQRPNRQFRQFAKSLRQGKHVLFVDVSPREEIQLDQVLQQYPRLQLAGIGPATPYWLVLWQHGWNRFRQMI
ncbi:MAG: magnesium transporter [Pseudomonas sp.]|uniref:magnesium transporter n=1 Tax=Pseudomonas sp. TaxID=306 RepID=UPI003392CF74